MAAAERLTTFVRRIGERMMFMRFRPCRPGCRGRRLMGWTLRRYFFFRYAAITVWYFLGVYALVTLIDFTEFSSRTVGPARLHLPARARRLGAARAA